MTPLFKFILLLSLTVGVVKAGLALQEDYNANLYISEKVMASEQEMAEGYFTIGPQLTILVRPMTKEYRWLVAHRDKEVHLVIGE